MAAISIAFVSRGKGCPAAFQLRWFGRERLCRIAGDISGLPARFGNVRNKAAMNFIQSSLVLVRCGWRLGVESPVAALFAHLRVFGSEMRHSLFVLIRGQSV